MPNYKNGKIYQIISPNCTEVYIGSTTQPLSVRMAKHRYDAKDRRDCRSCRIIEAGDSYIELIEEYSCENKEQLNKREGEIQRSRTCVNRKVAGRTPEEWNKQYRDEHKDSMREYQRAYYEKNKDRIIQRKVASRRSRKLQASQALEQVKEN